MNTSTLQFVFVFVFFLLANQPGIPAWQQGTGYGAAVLMLILGVVSWILEARHARK